MTLRDNLYTIKSLNKSEDKADFRVALNAENFIYKAHFPNNPITPGVCLIQMLQELAGVSRDSIYRISVLKNVKFITPISPLEFPEINFSLNVLDIEGKVQVKAVISENEVIFAKLNLILV